jgi:hypothetical protein
VVGRVQAFSQPGTEGTVVSWVEAGTILQVLESQGPWYYVVLATAADGSQSRAWVRSADVQVLVAAIPPSADAVRASRTQRDREQRQQVIEDHRAEQAERDTAEREARTDVTKLGRADGDGVPDSSGSSVVVRSGWRSYDIFAGYAPSWDTSDSITYPMGWAASAGIPLNEQIAIVVEGTGAYKSASVLGVTLASTNVHTFTAGPRIWRPVGTTTVYGQMLAGLAISHGSAFGVSASSSGFALSPGAGVDVPVGRSVAVRVGGEFGFIHDAGWYNGFRLMTGVVVRANKF